jgi:hypothetical protein
MKSHNFDFNAPCTSFIDFFSSKINGFKYDLYEYMQQIESIYKQNSLIAEYKFQNYAFMPDISERMDKVLLSKRFSMLNYKPHDLNLNKPFHMKTDLSFLTLLKRTRNFTECLKNSSGLKTIANSKSFKFANFMGKHMSFNHKAVFVTDMCRLIEHHSAPAPVPGAVIREVSKEHGVLSHFRDYNYNYTEPHQVNKWLSDTVQDYVIDLEMMHFLATHVEAISN